MNENYKRAQRLIKEGRTNTQDKFIDVMMDIKNSNPKLTHSEIMDLFQDEVDRFIKYHSKDRMDLPSTPMKHVGRVFRDKMPMMKIPYGDKKNKL